VQARIKKYRRGAQAGHKLVAGGRRRKVSRERFGVEVGRDRGREEGLRLFSEMRLGVGDARDRGAVVSLIIFAWGLGVSGLQSSPSPNHARTASHPRLFA
jgi:hypothetical protein